MSVKKPDKPPFQISPEAMDRFRTALSESFQSMSRMKLGDGYTLIDPEWLERARPAQTSAAEPKAEEEVKGYNGEWYQGPIPDTYEGEIPKGYSSKYRRLALDDEQKRIYCYEEDQWGTLRRKFIAQTDNKTVAEWIVAARNGRLVGKDSNEALLAAGAKLRAMERRLSDVTKASVDHMESAELNRKMFIAECDKSREAKKSMQELQLFCETMRKELVETKQKLASAHMELNAQKDARMAEIKDTGTRRLRLRSKE